MTHLRALAHAMINWLLDSVDTLRRKKDDLVPPRKISRYVGHGDFAKTGEEFLAHFIRLGKLEPHERVLDVGCGIGRMAIPLTRHLNNGTYEGFDIVPEAIDWCSRNITPRYPSFRFRLADIYNATYHPGGKYKASEFRFPYEDSSFDFVFLTSIFTHLLPSDMKHYLSEISRVMRPGARSVVTYFLLNDESKGLIAAGLTSRQFTVDVGGAMTANKDRPEDAIAYEETTIRELYGSNRLGILEPIRYGSWCERRDALSYQDIIIAEKLV